MRHRGVLLALSVLMTATVVMLAAAFRSDAVTPLTVSIRDFCDPVTFARIGCVRSDNVAANGSETLTGFNSELAQEKNVGAWRFNPARFFAKDDISLTVVNNGGETHTFTRVANFGGGFVAGLNAASGNPVPAPECAQMLPNGGLAPQPAGPENIFVAHGQTVQGPLVEEGREVKFQCCIHPWMRIVINARGEERAETQR